MRHVHGGDIYTYAEQFEGQSVLDFSANINPWGIAPPVRRAMRLAVDDCTRYPDPLCRALTAALADDHGLAPPMIFCANGAAEIFYRLADVLRPETALVTAPTFAEYELALRHHHCAVRYYALKEDEGFAVKETLIDALDGVDACFLCNPNNPTGVTIDPNIMRAIVAHCQKNAIWLVVDECFVDFLLDEQVHSLLPLVRQHDRLIVVRAFTKMYAVPGVRLGWCASSFAGLTGRLRMAGQPWPVSTIAEASGRAALTLKGYTAQTARAIAPLRQMLAQALTDCGLRVVEGQANYLLFYTPDTQLGQKLLARGLMIRDCANYSGLTAGYFRVAVKTQAENELLVREIREVLKNG